MTGHSKLSLENSLTALGMSIGLDLLLIPRWGLLGAAAGDTLCVVLLNVLRLIQVYALHRIQPYNLGFLKPICAALVAAVVAYIASVRLVFLPAILQLAIGVALLWGTYATIILLLRLDDTDRMILKRLWARFPL